MSKQISDYGVGKRRRKDLLSLSKRQLRRRLRAEDSPEIDCDSEGSNNVDSGDLSRYLSGVGSGTCGVGSGIRGVGSGIRGVGSGSRGSGDSSDTSDDEIGDDSFKSVGNAKSGDESNDCDDGSEKSHYGNDASVNDTDFDSKCAFDCSTLCPSVHPAMIHHDSSQLACKSLDASYLDDQYARLNSSVDLSVTACRKCLACVCIGCPECFHAQDSCNHCDRCRNGSYDSSDSYWDSSSDDEAYKSVNKKEGDQLEEEEEEDTLSSVKSSLSTWALTFNIALVALSALLKILKPFIPGLPRDGRTLLHTPRKTDVSDMPPGKYWHNGFVKGLLTVLNVNDPGDEVKVSVNIDGLPITRSTSSCVWPILCSALNKVFIVGAYHGAEKPKDPNVFLREFVKEAVPVVLEGIDVEGRHVSVSIYKLIADAPAKSFALNTAGHNSHCGCPKCKSESVWIKHRMSFLNLDGPLRTDAEFEMQTDGDYHIGPTPFTQIPGFGGVTSVCLDYMHVVCLGVMKKLMLLWMKGPLTVRVGTGCLNKINLMLFKLIGFLPSEFNRRRSRSLQYVSQFKATEFRQLLLYLGPIVFCPALPKEFFDHFMQLHVSIVILCSRRLCMVEDYVTFSETLLYQFVENFISVYGPEFISHNVHVLLHLPTDVRKFGCLDDFSAFPFENFMQGLKSLVRKPGNVLQQIARRYAERERHLIHKNDCVDEIKGIQPHSNGILPPQCRSPQFTGVKLPEFVLQLNVADNCCGLKNGSDVMVIENFATCCERKCIVAIGRVFRNVSNLYEKPLPSASLGILKVESLGTYQVWPVKTISTKYVRFPLEDGSFAVFPLLHHGQ